MLASTLTTPVVRFDLERRRGEMDAGAAGIRDVGATVKMTDTSVADGRRRQVGA